MSTSPTPGGRSDTRSAGSSPSRSSSSLERTLIPGAELHVVTDVEEYFGVIKALMATHPRFEVLPETIPDDPLHEQDYLTNFERKYRIEGRPIYRVRYSFR